MSIPNTRTMKAVIVEKPGGPEALKLVERPVPEPDRHEVLVKVAAAGLNGADVGQRLGRYRMPPGAPDIFGLEAAGEVVAVGAGVTQWRERRQGRGAPRRRRLCRICRRARGAMPAGAGEASRWSRRRRCRNAP